MLTFLITDIESSTEKWRRYGEIMGAALARHDEILETVIPEHGGRVVKNTGDGIFSVFEKDGEVTCNPLQCAIDIQRMLSGENWDRIGELRVRIAVHSGNAEKRRNDYFGPVVNETARLLEAAWGGQILLSQQTVDSCRIPPDAELADHGVHLLRGISEPHQIYGLLHLSLPLKKFPPLRTLNAHPNNLPQQPTRFIGRTYELKEIHGLLQNESCRLLTLLGTGGVGKTRIALKVAEECFEKYTHGVWFVALAPLSSAESITLAIASALKLSFYSSEDPGIQLLKYLKDKKMLLVMDNFEHLVEGAGLIGQIIQNAPMIKIVVTSRERLNLRDEWIYDVKGMGFPGIEEIDGRETGNALELFASSASRVRRDFRITGQNRLTVTEICRLIDGLPLGIEIAASWLRTLNLEEIASEIGSSFDFLESSLQDLPERHRSLEKVFEYSLQLLSPDEQKVLARLSVFRGGFTKEAAKEVAGASVSMLSSLIDKSLIQRTSVIYRESDETHGSAASDQYDMHEAVRQFAWKILAGTPEEIRSIRHLHCCYYADLLYGKEQDLTVIGQKKTLAEIEIELENVHAAWQWALDNGDIESTGRLLEGVYSLYTARGWFRDAVKLLSEAVKDLKTPETCNDNSAGRNSPVMGKLLLHLGWLIIICGDYEEGGKRLRECLEIFRNLGDRSYEAYSLNRLGSLALFEGDFELAKALQEESLTCAVASDSSGAKARSFMSLGNIARKSGEYAEAGKHYRESLKLFKEMDHVTGQAISLGNLGIVACRTGDLDEALRLDRESFALAEALDDRRMIAEGLTDIGTVFREMGNTDEAWKYYTESLSLNRELGVKSGILITLDNMGTMAAQAGDLEKAEELLTEALELSRELGRRATIVEILTGLGGIAVESGKYGEAEHRLRDALKVAKDLRVVPFVIELLTWIMQLLLKLDNREYAIELAGFIIAHPITSNEISLKVNGLFRETGSESLPAAVNSESRTFGQFAEDILIRNWKPGSLLHPWGIMSTDVCGFLSVYRGYNDFSASFSGGQDRSEPEVIELFRLIDTCNMNGYYAFE